MLSAHVIMILSDKALLCLPVCLNAESWSNVHRDGLFLAHIFHQCSVELRFDMLSVPPITRLPCTICSMVPDKIRLIESAANIRILTSVQWGLLLDEKAHLDETACFHVCVLAW